MKISLSQPNSAPDDIESILNKMDYDELVLRFKMVFAYWLYLVFVLFYNTQVMKLTFLS